MEMTLRFLSSIVGLAVSISFISCSTSKEYSSNEYKLQLVDSIVVPVVGNITISDYCRERNVFLIINQKDQSIIETDNKGKIINRLQLNGGEEKQYGQSVTNLSYYSDSSIIISSSRGYFIYDLSGKLLKMFADKCPLVGGEASKLSIISKEGTNYFMSFRKPAIPENLEFGFRNSTEFYNSYKPITLYNSSNNTSSQEFGFDPDGAHRKFDYYYGNTRTFFDVDSIRKNVYVLHNPDLTLYKYSIAKGFPLLKKIPLIPNFYKTEEKGEFHSSKPINMDRMLAVNSNYQSLNIMGDYIVASYNTGIPDTEFKEMISSAQWSEYFGRFDKRYLQVFYKDNKMCNDIEIPKESYTVAFLKSVEEIVTIPNAMLVERLDYSVFFVYKLEKI